MKKKNLNILLKKQSKFTKEEKERIKNKRFNDPKDDRTLEKKKKDLHEKMYKELWKKFANKNKYSPINDDDRFKITEELNELTTPRILEYERYIETKEIERVIKILNKQIKELDPKEKETPKAAGGKKAEPKKKEKEEEGELLPETKNEKEFRETFTNKPPPRSKKPKETPKKKAEPKVTPKKKALPTETPKEKEAKEKKKKEDKEKKEKKEKEDKEKEKERQKRMAEGKARMEKLKKETEGQSLADIMADYQKEQEKKDKDAKDKRQRAREDKEAEKVEAERKRKRLLEREIQLSKLREKASKKKK